MTRPSEDNVIYANFGARRRVSSAEETGSSTVQEPAEQLSHAAMVVLNAALRRTDAGRVKRGRDYAANAHVSELRVRPNSMDASVIGSQNEPFYAGFILPPRSDDELKQAMSAMAASPGGLRRAEQGDFPDEVLNVFLGSSPEEFRFFCDCPDPVDVCKHAVAVAIAAARRIDQEPATVFAIRNMAMDAVEASLRDGAYTIARENAEAGSEFFWTGREMPDLPRPKIAPMIDDSDTDLLRRAMESVSFTNIDLLNAVADIEDLYDTLVDPDDDSSW